MALNDILRNKVVRAKDSPTNGIAIYNAEAWAAANAFILSVRYFDLRNPETGMTKERDMLSILANDFVANYEICTNRDMKAWDTDAKFIPVDIYLDTWLDAQEGR